MRRRPTTASLCCLGIVASSLAVAGCRQPGGVRLSFVPADQTLEEKTVMREGALLPKVALVDVSGVLLDVERNGLLTEGENPVAFVTEQLDKAADDGAVEGVILRVNSPGGTITASQILYDEVLRYKDRTGKPVVAVMMDVAASGGYYLACASDRIVAHPSTITGSIGVIMQLFSLQGALDAIHVDTYAIKSGPFKDAGSPLRDLEPAEREMFQDIVEEFYSQFVMAVVRGRPHLNEQQVRQLADGRIFTAHQALEAGLIDEIGSLYTAMDWLRERTGRKRFNVVTYHRPLQYKGNIYAAAPAARTEPPGLRDLSLSTLNEVLRPKFLYLWAPGLTAGN